MQLVCIESTSHVLRKHLARIPGQFRRAVVHMLKTTDHDAAMQIAAYVAQHWKLKPAIHEFMRANLLQYSFIQISLSYLSSDCTVGS
jgi:hypothetical protein